MTFFSSMLSTGMYALSAGMRGLSFGLFWSMCNGGYTNQKFGIFWGLLVGSACVQLAVSKLEEKIPPRVSYALPLHIAQAAIGLGCFCYGWQEQGKLIT